MLEGVEHSLGSHYHSSSIPSFRRASKKAARWPSFLSKLELPISRRCGREKLPLTLGFGLTLLAGFLLQASSLLCPNHNVTHRSDLPVILLD
jgi:hypothetical protein